MCRPGTVVYGMARDLRLGGMTSETVTPPTFAGIPEAALDFFAGLQFDNSREYWLTNRETYERRVRAPVVALAAALAPRIGAMKVFRLQRDLRFSRDKTPYKTQQGAMAQRPEGGAWYVHVDDGGVLVASGYWRMERDQTQRLRQLIADDHLGPRLIDEIVALEVNGLRVSGGVEAPLKTRPRDYPADHPRIAQLRWKGVMVSRRFDDPALFGSPDLAPAITAFYDRTMPLLELVDRRVGPSEQPAEDRFRRRGG